MDDSIKYIISKFKYKINDMDPEEWVDSLESCGDLEQMDEDGEEDEERKVLTKEIAEQAMNDADEFELDIQSISSVQNNYVI